MRNACRVVALCVALVAGGAADARAEFDFPWLEKLSGPGPFWGVEVNYRFYCRVAQSLSPRGVFLGPFSPGATLFSINPLPTPPASGATARDLCTADTGVRSYETVGWHYYRSTRNDLIVGSDRDDVSIWGVDWKHAIRLDEALDLSMGAGFSVFRGAAVDTFARFRWVPAEIKFYPLVIDADAHDRLTRRGIYVTAGVLTYVPGFKASQLCGSECAVPFSEDPEALLKFGLHVDLGTLGELFD